MKLVRYHTVLLIKKIKRKEISYLNPVIQKVQTVPYLHLLQQT